MVVGTTLSFLSETHNVLSVMKPGYPSSIRLRERLPREWGKNPPCMYKVVFFRM